MLYDFIFYKKITLLIAIEFYLTILGCHYSLMVRQWSTKELGES